MPLKDPDLRTKYPKKGKNPPRIVDQRGRNVKPPKIVKMKAGLEEARWEAVAQGIALGLSRGAAYVNAGYKAKTSDLAQRQCRKLLANHPEIAARIVHLNPACADQPLMQRLLREHAVNEAERRAEQDRKAAARLDLERRLKEEEEEAHRRHVALLMERDEEERRRQGKVSYNGVEMSSEQMEIIQRLKDDLPHYAAKCLKIRTKAGRIVPLELNDAQMLAHARLEEQRARTGKVRALLLKARQQGMSTYIGARFYQRTTFNEGQYAFILTHEAEATQNLFSMTERFHSHVPEIVRAKTAALNARELTFGELQSGYSVGTAGTKAVGRSKTLQLFHGSEVAFWPNAASHFAGVLQAVPDLPGTEVILETTANGVGGEFHDRWQSAERGEGEYIAIFVPWFLTREYRRPVTPAFKPNDEEAELAGQFKLDNEQLAWRRMKLVSLKDPLLFKQEYPATAAEAFQVTGHDAFIKAEPVLAARKASLQPLGPIILGVDPSRYGDDRFSIVSRQGRVARRCEVKGGKITDKDFSGKVDVVGGANLVRKWIDRLKPRKVFIDGGGLGVGVADILISWGGIYAQVVVIVNFGGRALEPDKTLDDGTLKPHAKNRRSEMWESMRDWFHDEGGADIEDLDAWQTDLTGPSYSYDMQQRLLLESKESMRSRGVRSPDEGDALALTFAEPVFETEKSELVKSLMRRWGRTGGGSGSFMRA